MSRFLLDTSALIEFFNGTKNGEEVCLIIEDGEATTSVLCIAEISDKAWREGTDPTENIAFLEQNVKVLPLTTKSCKSVGKIKTEQRKKQNAFGLVDALLYLTAQENDCTLLTKDIDFKGLQGAELL